MAQILLPIMVMKTIRLLTPVCLLLGLVPEPASATILTYAFTGDVTSASGIWVGEGSTVTGFYRIDDSISVDSLPGDAAFDSFGPLLNPGLPWEISITIGSVTRTTLDNQNRQADEHHTLDAIDLPDRDQWIFRAWNWQVGDDAARLVVRDVKDSAADPDGLLPGSYNLTGTPIFAPGDLSLYNRTVGESNYFANDENGDLQGLVEFTLTSVSLVSVPAPPVAVLVFLGAAAAWAMGRR